MSEGWKENLGGRIRRFIREGDTYEFGEDVDIADVPPNEEPPVELQGEPWGWTKPGPRPRGWRKDGRYGPTDGPTEEEGRDWVRPREESAE
jgi:hypothetical protein